MTRALIVGGYKVDMKRALIIIALVALGVFALHTYASQPSPVVTSECAQNDSGCINNLNTNREECIPSSTVVTGRDGIILMVNITRRGGECVRTETVIGYEELQSSYLVGHNVTCVSDLSDLEDPRSQVCPGSLYDYVVPSGAGEGGGSGGGPPGPPPIPSITCDIDDEECKATADGYLQNCTNSRITNTVQRWEPDGYWTLFFNVSKQQEECQYYVEVLNAVNLPPGTPISIIGSNMTCNIPLSEFPVGILNSTWCEGNLYTYLYP